MDNPIQNEPEGLKDKHSFGCTEAGKTTEETSMSIKDQDTTLSMIVLLLACLLAVLAQFGDRKVFVPGLALFST